MVHYNQTVSEFIIVGFRIITKQQYLFFTLLFLLYFIIIAGNLIIVLVILFNSHFHIPMYFLICALCISEMGIVVTVYPTIFSVVLNGKAHVSFNCCFLQMYIFHSLIITENYLLNIMAYDRYVAICKALHYHSIMTLKSSKTLIYLCWILGFITPLTWVILGYNLPFCGPNEIQHLFCDSSPLLDLACTTNDFTVIIDLLISSFTIILTSGFITVTYASILVRILKMKISEDRKKALSTCASSLIISVVFYGSAALMYIQLQRSYSPEYDFATAIHHSFLTPLLSPLVYSFRNKDIKNFLKQLLQPKRVLRGERALSESIERETC